MSKKLKIIILLSGCLALVLLALFTRTLILNIPYRTQIPALPDLQSLSEPLKEQLTSAYKKAYRNPSTANLGMLGMVYYSSAFYDKAGPSLTLAVKRDNSAWLWSYYLGYLNQEMGNTLSAIENYRTVLMHNQGNYMACYYTAECYRKLGRNDSAEMAFNKIIRLLDKNAVVRTADRYDYFPLVTYSMYHLSRLYIETKRLDEAEKLLLEIVDHQRAFGPAYRLLGNVFSLKGDEVKSKRYLTRANDLAENPLPVDTLIDKLSLMSRSDMYILKRIDEAEKSVYSEYALKLVHHALPFMPDNKYLIAKAIKLLLVLDNGNLALPFLGKHLQYFQKDFSELKNVGDLLYNKGYYPQAINYYSVALDLRSEDSKVQSCMVIAMAKAGRKTEAIEWVNKILEKNSTSPAILADAVTLYFTIGEKEKANYWLSKLRSLSPSYPKGQQIAGMISERGGRFKEALALYESSFKGDPGDLATERLLGNLLIQQKMWEKAIIHFNKSLEYHPNEPFLLERLGTLLVSCPDQKLRNLSEGRDYCERAFIHNASHSITLISAGRSLAIAYSELHDKRNARNIIKMTIDLAKKGNLPTTYLEDLEKLLQQYSSPN
jgi:tetratricopeptide (TPR) repeat protein